MAQFQKTIFGTEEECKPKGSFCAAQARFVELTVALSEDASRPVYIARNGHGAWYMSVDGKAYGRAPGTLMGITGDWEFFGIDHITRAILEESFTGMIGMALMNGTCIMIEGMTQDSVTFSTFGALRSPDMPVTIYRRGKRWTRS